MRQRGYTIHFSLHTRAIIMAFCFFASHIHHASFKVGYGVNRVETAQD
jgi:hypothetical protein